MLARLRFGNTPSKTDPGLFEYIGRCIGKVVRFVIRLIRPEWLVKPTLRLTDVTAIDPLWLKDKGIKGLIFDMDDTLIPWFKPRLIPAIKEKVVGLKEAGFQGFILSNSLLKKHVTQIAGQLKLPYLGKAKKPRTDGFEQALKQMGLTRNQVIVVGDRPLTDLLGAKRMGMKSILVDGVGQKEFFLRRWLRKLENCLVVPAAS